MLKNLTRRIDSPTDTPAAANLDYQPTRSDSEFRTYVRDDILSSAIGPSNAPTPSPGDQGSVIAQLRIIAKLLNSIDISLSAAHPW